MATNWILGKVSEALAPTVHSTVSAAGAFAGGAINALGNSINGVGEGINNSIRRYGDGAKDYGNSIMDWTKADGYREPTASNPLGLSGGTASGKRHVTFPTVYSAPSKAPSKTPSKPTMTANMTVGTQKVVDKPKAMATTSKL